MGIELTMGSDSHAPTHIGRYFDEIKQVLRSKGVAKLIKFNQHNKDFLKL